VPQHRKPVHRPKILAAVLAVSLTAFGVAFAAEVEQEPAGTAHEPPRLTRSPSSPASSTAQSDVVITDERRVRPSRSADARERLREKDREKPRPRPRTESPEPTEEPEVRPEVTPTPAPEVKAPKPDPAPTRKAPVAGSTIIDGTNAARANAGLPGLSVSSCLAGMAQQHAERLAAAQNLHHQDLGGVMSGCGMSTAGENVAMNYDGPTAMVNQWLESTGHRANLLSNRFSLIGVGVAQASDGSWYGVQVFGAS